MPNNVEQHFKQHPNNITNVQHHEQNLSNTMINTTVPPQQQLSIKREAPQGKP
jgi:hypothetical protein